MSSQIGRQRAASGLLALIAAFQCLHAGLEDSNDRVDVVNASCSCADADLLQGSPEPGVLGQIRQR